MNKSLIHKINFTANELTLNQTCDINYQVRVMADVMRYVEEDRVCLPVFTAIEQFIKDYQTP